MANAFRLKTFHDSGPPSRSLPPRQSATMKHTSLHILALLVLVLSSLCVRSEAAFPPATMTALQTLVTTFPYLQTLTPYPWTTSNIQLCKATGLGCDIDLEKVLSIFLAAPTVSGSFPPLNGLTDLSTLSIIMNLTGTLPASWSTFTKLQNLVVLTEAGVTGTIPASYSAMTQLGIFEVQFTPNQAAITLPNWLGTVSATRIHNAVLSEFPAFMASTSNSVRALTLESVQMSGSFPAALWQSTLLNTLVVTAVNSESFGVGSALPSLASMTSISTLSISGVGIGGSIPASLPPFMNSLSLSSLPNLQGTIPQTLMDSTELGDLVLNELPGLTGNIPGPTTPSSSVSITLAYVALPGLTGTISPNLFNTPALSQLVIRGCTGLTGGLPDVVAEPDFSSLSVVEIVGNPSLGGSIPSTWIAIPSLTSLKLESKGLTGSIPPAYARLPTVMNYLSLAGNTLMGTVPNMTFTPSFSSIILSNCSLTGTIPLSLANKILRRIYLEGNNFDMCANAGTTEQAALAMKFQGGICELAPTSGRSDCACPGTWPEVCFDVACPPVPVEPISAPIAPPTSMPTAAPTAPTTPTSTPIAPSTAPSSAPSAVPTTPTVAPSEPIEPSDAPESSTPLPPAAGPITGPISIPSFIPSLEPTGSASSTSFGFALFVIALLAVFFAL